MNRSLSALLTVSLTSLAVLGSACSKDEKKPEAAASASAAPLASSTPDAGEAARAKEQVGEPRKDEMPRTAEPSTTPPPGPGARAPLPTAVSSPVPEQPALAATSLATLPKNVLAVVGTPSLKALVDAFMLQAKQVPSLAVTNDPLPFALERLKLALGLSAISWLAVDQPLRLVIPDAKAYPDGFVLVIPIVAGAKLEPSAFANAKPNADGHWLGLQVTPERMVYVDREGDLLTVSTHAKLTQDLGSFMKELVAWTPTDPLVLDGSVTNARTLYATELAGFQTQLGQMSEQLEKAGMPKTQLQAMQTVATSVFGVVQGLDRVGVAIDPRGAFPRVTFAFRANAGSPFAATLADLQKRRPTLAPLIPAEAWFATAYDADFGDLMTFDESVTQALVQAGWPLDEAKGMSDLVKKLGELATGSGAFWLTSSGAFPIALESATAVSDGPAFRETLLGFFGKVFDRSWGTTRAQLVASGMDDSQLPGLGFNEFVSGISRISKGFGITPSLPTAPGVDTIALDLDWSRAMMGRIPVALRDALGAAVGSRLELSLGTAPTRYSFAFGPHAAARAAELTAASVDAAVADPWIARAAKDGFMVLALRPTRFARALADFPQFAREREAIGKLPDDPLLFEGQSDGTALRVTVTLPIATLVGLFTSF